MADQTEAQATNAIEVNTEALSTNFYYTLGNDETFNMQFTVRGNPTGAEIEAHVRAVISAAKHIVALGGHAKQVGAQSYTPKASKADEAINIEAQISGLPLPTVALPVSEPVKAAGVDTSTVFQIHAVKFEIEPRPDGKSKIKFYEAGHKYPDIDAVQTPERLAKLMSATGAWQPDHFKAIASQACDYVIDYRNSEKLNSKGNPYKDIVAIHTAA